MRLRDIIPKTKVEQCGLRRNETERGFVTSPEELAKELGLYLGYM